MSSYRGIPGSWATDGCACYRADGSCKCAECYYFGDDHVNCIDAGTMYNYPEVEFSQSEKTWVLKNS